MGNSAELQQTRWLSYDIAKIVIHSARKVPTTRVEYYKWHDQNRPVGIPKRPHRVYLKEWTSWNDWLQNDNEFIVHEAGKWQSYWEAMRYVHGRKFKCRNDYKEAVRLDDWPKGIPKSPYSVYSEWVDWPTWLGVTLRSRVESVGNIKQCVAFCVMEGVASNILKVIVCKNGVDELKKRLESIGSIRVHKLYEWNPENFEQFNRIMLSFGSDQGNDDWLIANSNALFFELDSVLVWWR